MKNSIKCLGGFFILLALTFQSCLKDSCEGTRTFIQYSPIYVQVDEIRQNIEIQVGKDLVNPGKLYFYDDYIFINEIREGIHIINNADPANPQNVAFVAIPGNMDMAVKEGILYADNYIDLLSLDISNPERPELITRTENVFTSLSQNEDLGHLVYYEETEETIEVNCNDPRFGGGWFWQEDAVFVDNNASSAGGFDVGSSGGGNAPIGVAGSQARFALYDCFLYAIDQWNIQVFNVTNTTNPVLSNTVNVSWGIETLFPYKDKLFIGSESGLFIYDNSNPTNPTYLSEFQHARACDPVYVNGDHAFVTLRDGTFCEGFINQLDVIDISDLENPSLVKTHEMDNPHGLSIKNEVLYLCEGTHGLKSFDIEDLEKIGDNRLDWVKNFDAYDVIALPNKDVLFVIGKDGLFQFDASDNSNLRELSVLPVVR